MNTSDPRYPHIADPSSPIQQADEISRSNYTPGVEIHANSATKRRGKGILAILVCSALVTGLGLLWFMFFLISQYNQTVPPKTTNYPEISQLAP